MSDSKIFSYTGTIDVQGKPTEALFYREMCAPQMTSFEPVGYPLFVGNDPYEVSIADFMKLAQQDSWALKEGRVLETAIRTMAMISIGKKQIMANMDIQRIFLSDFVVQRKPYELAETYYKGNHQLPEYIVAGLFKQNCSKYIAVRGNLEDLQEKPEEFFTKDHHYLYIVEDQGTVVLHHQTGAVLHPEPTREQQKFQPKTLGDICRMAAPI